MPPNLKQPLPRRDQKSPHRKAPKMRVENSEETVADAASDDDNSSRSSIESDADSEEIEAPLSVDDHDATSSSDQDSLPDSEREARLARKAALRLDREAR